MAQNTIFQQVKNNFLLSHQKLVFFTRFYLVIEEASDTSEFNVKQLTDLNSGRTFKRFAMPVMVNKSKQLTTVDIP